MREKLRKIQIERTATEARLANTGEVLAIGANVLLGALDLKSDPEATYTRGTDEIRRTSTRPTTSASSLMRKASRRATSNHRSTTFMPH